MFLATKVPGKPMDLSKISPPVPSVPGTGGPLNREKSRCAWQSMHSMTWLARYSPRSIRSGVISMVMSSGGPTLGMVSMTHPRTANTISNTAPRPYKVIFKAFFMVKLFTIRVYKRGLVSGWMKLEQGVRGFITHLGDFRDKVLTLLIPAFSCLLINHPIG